MCNDLQLQLKAAETLIDSASDLIMDAAGVLNDAGDRIGMARLEELAVVIAGEAAKLVAQREALGASVVAA